MYKWLKRGRVIVSLTITVLITLAFLFFSNRDNFFFSSLLKYQFIPALLGVFTGSAIILALLVLMSLLFGRLYCSTICPLGTLQDSVWRISSLFRSKKNRRFSFSKANNILRYSFLSVAAIPLLFGSSFVISLLDPYSNYGKISSEIISRSEQFIHNILSSVFPDTIFFRSYSQFIAISFFFALFFLLIVIFMSAFRGRLYCNSVCPVGTTLGFIS
ncbi:MAG: 4Fe-4S binding protein, partial [Bacteroidales bacterium]|nr:4Fe-4S binding protein [Bacteroidales bacterium]